MPSMPIALMTWKPFARNTLRGFADVRVGKSLVIREVAVHVSHGKAWASLPSKPVLKDGRATTDERGKVRYVPMMEWADKEARDAFSDAVVRAVRAQAPDAVEP